MDNFTKVVRLGTTSEYSSRPYSAYCKIEYKDGNLSLTGVEGPTRDGNCKGSCGQISQPTIAQFAPEWDQEKLDLFFATWDRWHLNDMRAGSMAQEQFLRDNPVSYQYPESHYEVASKALADAGLNPDQDGYKYGSAWKREEVPTNVLEFLKALPDTDLQPTWV